MQREIYKIFASWTTYDEKMIAEWNKIKEECDLTGIEIHEVYVDNENEDILKQFKVTNIPCFVFNRKFDEEKCNRYITVNDVITFDILKKCVNNLKDEKNNSIWW